MRFQFRNDMIKCRERPPKPVLDGHGLISAKEVAMSTINQRRSDKERFWRRMIRQWRSSGLSVRAFCAERELAVPSFYGWRRTIAQRDAEAFHFVPVHVVPEEQPVTEDKGGGLELVLPRGRQLRIGPGFDAPTLQRLLTLLEEGRP
jgi:transposase